MKKINYFRLFWLSLYLLLSSTNLLSQIADSITTPIDTTSYADTNKYTIKLTNSSNIELPSIIQPSPQAKAMTIYGDYPVGHNTGIPEIAIPIYEVKIGQLTLPLRLKTHPSGRKPEERDGLIGYGWTLEYGGIITRTKRGIKDDYSMNYFLPKTSINDNCFIEGENGGYYNYETYAYNLLEGITNYSYDKKSIETINNFDSQYDVFNYVLPSGSGKFLLIDSVIDGILTKQPFTIPYKPIIIKTSFKNYKIEQFIITDVDGTQYFFGKTIDNANMIAETVNTFSKNIIANEWSTQIQFSEELAISHPLSSQHITAWNITGIVSANKIDTIKFEYSSPYYINNYEDIRTERCDYNSSSVTISDKIIYDTYLSQPQRDNFPMYYEKKLTYTFSDYNYSSSRLKCIKTRNLKIELYSDENSKILDSILVKNLDEVQVEKVDFNYIKPPGELNHFLHSLIFNGNNNSFKMNYYFTYYSGTFYQYPHNGQSYMSRFYKYNKDWWGYYNGIYGAQNKWSVPNFSIDINMQDVYDTFRDTRLINLESGFVNRNTNEDACKSGMIKSITYPTGGMSKFDYESNRYMYYDVEYSGPGIRIKSIENIYEDGKKTYRLYRYGKGNLLKSLHPNLDNYMLEQRERTIVSNCHIPPGQTTSWCTLGYFDYRIRTVNSEFTLETTSLTPTNVFYDNVSEFISNENNIENATIRTDYYYNPIIRNVYNYKYSFIDPNNQYTPVNKLKFLSDKFSWKGGKLKMEVMHKKTNDDFNEVKKVEYHYSDYVKSSLKELVARKYFIFSDYTTDYFSHNYSSTDLQREMGDATFCYTHNEYISGAELLIGIKEVEKTSNDSIIRFKAIEYEPTHFQISKEKMFDSKSTIEQDENGMITGNGDNYTTQFKYAYNFNEIPYTLLVKQNILSPIIEKTEFRNNDKFLKRIKTNYFNWSSNIIAPQSIELQTNSMLNPEKLITYTQYNNYGNPLSFVKNDDLTHTYIWSYNYQYPIAEIKNASYNQVQSAVPGFLSYIEQHPNPSDLQLNSLFNTLRTNLPNAQVTTYTYKPLVGMTSMTDPRGVTTFYQYDSFNRLQFIKNKDGIIIQSFDYNYKQH